VSDGAVSTSEVGEADDVSVDFFTEVAGAVRSSAQAMWIPHAMAINAKNARTIVRSANRGDWRLG
jgi:hypothetical protein